MYSPVDFSGLLKRIKLNKFYRYENFLSVNESRDGDKPKPRTRSFSKKKKNP